MQRLRNVLEIPFFSTKVTLEILNQMWKHYSEDSDMDKKMKQNLFFCHNLQVFLDFTPEKKYFVSGQIMRF